MRREWAVGALIAGPRWDRMGAPTAASTGDRGTTMLRAEQIKSETDIDELVRMHDEEQDARAELFEKRRSLSDKVLRLEADLRRAKRQFEEVDNQIPPAGFPDPLILIRDRIGELTVKERQNVQK